MNKVFKTPHPFNHLYIKHFLVNIEELFKMENKQISDVYFDLSSTHTMNIVGALLIYKFLDYSVHNKCFYNPATNLTDPKSNYVKNELLNMGFKTLVQENFRDTIPIDKELVYQENKGCFVSPTVLAKDATISGYGKQNELKISNYYSYDATIAQTILSCMGEISSNFQEHAETDTRSVIIAKGDKKHFEIACADNGVGIISSLKTTRKCNCITPEYLVLEEAIKMGVSSKLDKDHMGCGLWLINEFVTKSKGYLCIYSENAYLINKKGTIKRGQSPFWKGTIVYIDIPLSNPACLLQVYKSVKTNRQYIK